MHGLRAFLDRIAAAWQSSWTGKLGLGCGALALVMLCSIACVGLILVIPTPEETSERPLSPTPGTPATSPPTVAPASSPTSAPPTPTPSPVPPTFTPTPSHPSFSKDEVLEVPDISSVVGEGEASFEEEEEPGKLRIEIDGRIPVVEGYWCLCCVDTIHIEPNVRVSTHLFTNNMEASLGPGGAIPDDVEVSGVVVSSSVPEDATQFIVSGPEGATLKKEGQGFRLVEGEAYLLQTAPAMTTPTPVAATETPTLRPTTPPSTAPEPSVRIALAGQVPDWAAGKMELKVLEGDYKLATGATLRAGSQVYVFEDALTFPTGLMIEVGQGGVTLRGTDYAEGDRLFVYEGGTLTQLD